jgi:hypothetical protein
MIIYSGGWKDTSSLSDDRGADTSTPYSSSKTHPPRRVLPDATPQLRQLFSPAHRRLSTPTGVIWAVRFVIATAVASFPGANHRFLRSSTPIVQELTLHHPLLKVGSLSGLSLKSRKPEVRGEYLYSSRRDA